MCWLSGLFCPFLFLLRCFDPLHWLLVLSFAAEMRSAPDWNGGGQAQREKKERSEWRGEWERQGRKESLQGKWMVGMCASEWTARWAGGAQVLCWGSGSQSGCDWHQKQHFMAENTVAERLGANHTFSTNRRLVLVVNTPWCWCFCQEGSESKTFPQFCQQHSISTITNHQREKKNAYCKLVYW